MLKKIMLSAVVAAVASLWAPAKAEAYGACHTGYTHVGPNGCYHTGSTAVSGPGGTYGRTSTGGAYHTGGAYGGAYHTGGAYGATYHAGYGGASVTGGGYHYTTGYSGYSGGAAAGGYHYGYVR